MEVPKMIPFEHWLIENYGYENGVSYGENPPNCVKPDGTFYVEKYGKWKDLKYKEYEKYINSINHSAICGGTNPQN